MTEDMDMIFTFHPADRSKNSNFTYKSSEFVWKYELELKTGEYKYIIFQKLIGWLLKTENIVAQGRNFEIKSDRIAVWGWIWKLKFS